MLLHSAPAGVSSCPSFNSGHAHLLVEGTTGLVLGWCDSAVSEVESHSEHANTGGYTSRVEMRVVGPWPLEHTKAHGLPSLLRRS